MNDILNRHRADLVALAFGLLFVSIGSLSLAHALDAVDVEGGGFVGLTLTVIGAVGAIVVIVAAFRRIPADEPASSPTSEELEAIISDELDAL